MSRRSFISPSALHLSPKYASLHSRVVFAAFRSVSGILISLKQFHSRYYIHICERNQNVHTKGPRVRYRFIEPVSSREREETKLPVILFLLFWQATNLFAKSPNIGAAGSIAFCKSKPMCHAMMTSCHNFPGADSCSAALFARNRKKQNNQLSLIKMQAAI